MSRHYGLLSSSLTSRELSCLLVIHIYSYQLVSKGFQIRVVNSSQKRKQTALAKHRACTVCNNREGYPAARHITRKAA